MDSKVVSLMVRVPELEPSSAVAWKAPPVIEPAAMEKFQDILVQGHVLEPGKRVKLADLVVTEFFNKAK